MRTRQNIDKREGTVRRDLMQIIITFRFNYTNEANEIIRNSDQVFLLPAFESLDKVFFFGGKLILSGGKISNFTHDLTEGP